MKNSLKKYSILIFLIASFHFSYSQAPNWVWVNSLNINGSINGMTTDYSGNSYITGVFYDSVTLGNIKLISHGGADIFIAKCSSQGDFVWASEAGSKENDVSNDICLDDVGNLYICGGYYDTIQFGTYYLYSDKAAENNFVAQYDINSGNCNYVKQIGTPLNVFNSSNIGTGYLSKIRIDSDGNFYLDGVTDYNLDGLGYIPVNFGGQVGNGNYIVKYDKNFNLDWVSYVQPIINNKSIYPLLINDNLGNGYSIGTLYDTSYCENNLLNTSGISGNSNTYLLKYDNYYGNLDWNKLITGDTIMSDFASANNGSNIYLTGTYMDTCDFDSLHQYMKEGNTFLAKYDFNGKVIWTKDFNLNFPGIEMTDDHNGNTALVGNFIGTIKINDSIIFKLGRHIFISLLDSSGNIQWTRYDTAIGNNYYGFYPSTLAFDNAGNLLIAGNTSSTVILGNDTLKGIYGEPISFIAKLGNNASGVSNLHINPVSIKLFPNPTSNQLTISSSSLAISSIQIDNILGQQMVSFTQNYIPDQNIFIDVSSLTQGVYIIACYTNRGIVNTKFVKE